MTDKHKTEIKEEIVIEFICYDCNLGFTFEGDFKDHLQTHNNHEPELNLVEKQETVEVAGDEILQFECSACGRNFESLEATRIHIEIFHSGNYYHCDKCPKFYNTKKGIQAHLNLTHFKQFLSLENDLTGFDSMIPGLEDMKFHFLYDDPAKFKCDICGKGFKSKHDIRPHMLVHTELRPFECNSCFASFKTNNELKKHQLVHTEDRPFKCPNCPMKFKAMKYLRQHQHVHSDERPYKCDLCSASFKLKQNLKEHHRVHNNEKNFECLKCPAAFKTNKELVRHGIVHKLFKCGYCGDVFKKKWLVLRHQKKDCTMGIIEFEGGHEYDIEGSHEFDIDVNE